MNQTDEYLQHWGVLGMKWGVRRKMNGRIAARATQSFLQRYDQKWTETVQTKGYNQVYSKAAPSIRKGTRILNRDPKYKGQNFKKDSPLRREYYAAYSKMVSEQLNAAVGRISILHPLHKIGTSPLRKYEMHFTYDMSKDVKAQATIRRTSTLPQRKADNKADKVTRSFKHSDDFVETPVTLEFDEMGFITNLIIPEEVLEQGMSLTDEYLQHWGVLGMHWGVRKGDSEITKGGIFRKKAKKVQEPVLVIGKKTSNARTPADHLSDQELKDRISRITLEGTYAKLTETRMHKAQTAIANILLSQAKTSANEYISKYMKENIMPDLAKRLAKATAKSVT